jgi:hypothetical protein
MARRVRSSIWLVGVLLIATSGFARLKDIRTDKLPQQQSVQEAFAEAAAVEEFAQAWSDKWRYDKPKDAVVSELKDSLDKLQKAASSAPDNAELLILIGVVAHLAYNVDVNEAYDVAVSSLQKAHQLAPDDYRAEWFLGVHECEGAHVNEGMAILLAVENRTAWDHLPPDFWGDYMFCASLAGMPAHLLRAGDHLSKLDAALFQHGSWLMDTARKRFRTPDLTATYSDKEAWEARNQNGRWLFTSYMCGVSFSALGEWKLHSLQVQKGICVVRIETGPYPSEAGDVIPNLLLMARQPKPGEKLSDFMKVFIKGPSVKPLRVSRCPSEQCLSCEMTTPKAYGAAGNGYALLTVFQREAPEFPGLVFEEPAGPEAPKDSKVTYFRPNERIHRMEGTLYYMVLLDTADSVLDKAKQDYDTLLAHLQAE